jgi:dolichyl-diphosphooligosaccharide---protein glycosyltransferase
LLSDKTLFRAGNFEFSLRHLLIIGVLSLSFSISMLIRSQAADYGFELHEFDPFFNYRATQYIVDNGIVSYAAWHDDMSWYPNGRDVFGTSQVLLHTTAAIMYSVFGAGSSLYDFTIVFPMVFGSLTAVVVFALVRVIGGTTAGLFGALFYSISLPVISRGTIGWFKSEPLGLFYGVLALYLFLSGLKSPSKKVAAIKMIGAGIIFGFSLSAWGGNTFLVLPFGIFILALPFLRGDGRFLAWAIPVFMLGLAISLAPLERPGLHFFTISSGLMLIGPTLFVVACYFIQKINAEKKNRNSAILLAAIVIAGIVLLSADMVGMPSFRYLNALNPFLTSTDPLVDSVAEHATTSIFQSFLFNSVFMLFGAIGAWLIFKNILKPDNQKRDVHAFALIFGLLAVYISSAFVRLELYASLGLIILGAVGLSILVSELFRKQEETKKGVIRAHPKSIKISFVAMIIVLCIIPLMIPASANWVNGTKIPPTILNGGSNYNIATNDWLEAMDWLKTNTPEDSKVLSWWDYGYWITTLGQRTTFADNATIDTAAIQKIARILLSPPDEAWKALQEMDADYVLVYVAAQRIDSEPPLYLVQGGGDESKKQWFMRIGGFDETRFLYNDNISPKPEFWNNTLLGSMIPFTTYVYIDAATQRQSSSYLPGYTALYLDDIKFAEDGSGPLQLAYMSPSFLRPDAGPINGVLIYKVNENYTPQTVMPQQTSQDERASTAKTATITTEFGNIVIALKPEVAPKTVENFVKLANSNFYDGTLFHRIMPNFMIQGGDPNTKDQPPQTWGTGGPGYSIDAELSDIKHTKYIVSMARGNDINSAGSQFFIMVGNAPWLDGLYTVFGEVVEGHDVVDKIAALQTNPRDQPLDIEKARIKTIRVN